MAYRKAIIATWNKMVRTIFALLTNNVEFDSSHG